MHELSLALRIAKIAAEAADREGGAKVRAVHVTVGPLAGVVPAALVSAFELACADSPLAGSRLVVNEAPLVIWCPTCGTLRALDSILEMRCGRCGTASGDVRGGRELEVTAMEIEA